MWAQTYKNGQPFYREHKASRSHGICPGGGSVTCPIIDRQVSDLIEAIELGPDTDLLIARGEFKGKESIKRFFLNLSGPKNPEFLHQVMQLSGIVDVAPDGKTAQGRWYGFGATAMPEEQGVFQWWMNGVYENEYIKDNGKWKIKRIHWCTILMPHLKKDG